MLRSISQAVGLTVLVLASGYVAGKVLYALMWVIGNAALAYASF